MSVFVAQCCGESYDIPVVELFEKRKDALKFIRREILGLWGAEKTDTILIERPDYRGIRYINYHKLYRFINRHFKKYCILTSGSENLLTEINCFHNINRICQLTDNCWTLTEQEINKGEIT